MLLIEILIFDPSEPDRDIESGFMKPPASEDAAQTKIIFIVKTGGIL